MIVDVPDLQTFDCQPSAKTEGVVIRGKTEGGEHLMFGLNRDKVTWVIAKMIEALKESAKKTGWKPTPIAGNEDTGFWMRPTQLGLVETDKPAVVNLVIDVGPTRLRFELPRSQALEIGRVLSAASARQDQKN